jgi:hypothetical protein
MAATLALFRTHQPSNLHDVIDEDVHTLDLFTLAREAWATTWVPLPATLTPASARDLNSNV